MTIHDFLFDYSLERSREVRNVLSEWVAVLDGWRAISILLVLAAHFLPLGPKPWQLNIAAGWGPGYECC